LKNGLDNVDEYRFEYLYTDFYFFYVAIPLSFFMNASDEKSRRSGQHHSALMKKIPIKNRRPWRST